MYKSQVTAWKRLVFLLLLIGATLISRAQVYPVQLSTLVAPPYSIYLPDYASPGGEKLRLVLLQRDLTVQGYRLRFEMKVQVNGITIMQTSRSAVPPPITLQPGIPTVLGGSDLSWYVQPQNLEFGGGYSSSTYEQSRSLPEGPITITFTAYDYTRSDVQVSATASSFFYATRDNPPLLNYPACGMQVTPINPQFLNFSWLPQNTSSPNSALQTNYIFSLYAVLPAGYNFQDIVQSTRPVYSVTTQQPNLVYGPGEPPLVPGQSYAWRVQAMDATGRDIFRNNGYSETCNFIYSGDSSQGIVNYPPIQISAASAGPAQGKISWATAGSSLSLSGYDAYRLYYRKAQGDYDWFSVDVSDSMYRVFDLEPSTAYECRLQGHKSGSYGPYTDIANFTTAAPRSIGCTDNTSMLGTPSGRPLAVATGGMNITYGPWDVQLLTVQPLGSPGQFKGTCKVTVPFMGAMTFNAKFDNLTIDDSRNVTAGNIVFLSQGLQAWIDSSIRNQMGGSMYGGVVSGTDTTNVVVKVSLANLDHLDVVDSSNGDIKKVILPDNSTVIVPDGMQELTIKDSSGNTYSLDNQGNLTQLSLSDGSLQNFFASASNVVGLNTLASGVGTVTFTDADSKYAFDAWKPFYAQASTILTGQYEKLSGGSGDYYVPQKAIGAGESDIVGLNIDLPNNMDEDSLVFATGKGTRLIWDPKDYTLNLIGGPAADAQEVYALYPKPGGGYYSLGKLLVSAYEHQDFTAVLVPVAVGGVAPQVDRQQYEDALNNVYNKVNVSWKVVLDSVYANTGWDANGDGLLNINGSSFFSNALTGEPAALAKAYKNQRPVDNSKRYIFLLNSSDNNSSDPGVLAGDMPRSTLYGFIFPGARTGGQSAATTLVHELGHGQFNLEHTFSGDIALGGQGATSAYPNLMDYVGVDDVHLYKYQWNQVHQPGQVLGMFESDTAGKSVSVTDITQLAKYKNSQNGLTFINPAGKRISLPYDNLQKVVISTGDQWVNLSSNQPTNVFTAIGVLQSFTLKDETGTQLLYAGQGDQNNFTGYFNNGKAYQDNITAKLGVPATNPNDYKSILGIPYHTGNQFLLNISTIQVKSSYAEEVSLSNQYIKFVDNLSFLSDFLLNKNSLTAGDQNIQVVPNVVHDFALSYLKDNLGSSSDNLIRSIQVWRNAMLMDQYSAVCGQCIVQNDEFIQALSGSDLGDGDTPLFFTIKDPADIPSLEQLNQDYFTLSTRLSQMNGFFTNPDDAIKRMTANDSLIGFLKANPLECLYDNISLKTRISLLQQVANTKDNVEVFGRLISSMPETDAPAFLTSLSASNYALLVQFLDSYAKGQTDFTKLQTYFYAPISALIQQYLKKPNPDPAPSPTNLGSVQQSNALVVDFGTPESLMTNVDESGPSVVINSIWLGFDGLKTSSLKLFDFVTIYLLSDITLPNNVTLKKGQSFQITAFEAICLSDVMEKADRQLAQRFMVDVLMLATPLTEGAGTFNVIMRSIDIAGKAVALVDIGIQSNKDLIAASFDDDGKAVLNSWDNLYTTVQTLQVISGGVQLTRAVSTGAIAFCTSAGKIFEDASKEASFLQALKEVYKDKAENVLTWLKQNYTALKSLFTGAEKVDMDLLADLEALSFRETTDPGTYKAYVAQNQQKLLKNYKTIWAMSNARHRGKLVELLMSLTDYSADGGWQYVGSLGGGTQPLVDFFHTSDGMLVQLKSFNSSNAGYISTAIDKFEEIIDRLNQVRINGGFTLANGQRITVRSARFDIAVPKGFDKSIFSSLESYNANVPVNIIFK